MPEHLGSNEQKLGYLLAQQARLSDDLRDIKQMLREQSDDSKLQRSTVNRTLAEQDRRLEAIESKMQALEPIGEEFNRWRERGVGAMMVITFFVSSVSASIGFFWTQIQTFVGRLFS